MMIAHLDLAVRENYQLARKLQNLPIANVILDGLASSTYNDPDLRFEHTMIARNLIANYLAAIWLTILQLIAVPIFIYLLGLKAYGVLGVQSTLVLLASAFDFGLTPTLGREMARTNEQDPKSGRSAFQILERTYLALCLMALLAGTLILPQGLFWWLALSEDYSDAIITLRLMSAQVVLQMLVTFYLGGLLGLQLQVKANSLNVIFITARYIGAFACAAVTKDLDYVLIWLLVGTVIQALVVRIALVSALGPRGGSSYNIRNRLQFTGGMAGIVALSLILTQIDKIILSRVLTLSEFGLYMTASTFAAAIGKSVSPLFAALVPRFHQLVASKNASALTTLYHQSSQLAALLIVPATGIAITFAPTLFQLWLPISADARLTSAIFQLLLIGHAFNSIVLVPYSVSLAYGWTKYGLVQNVIACLVMIPLTWFLTKHMAAPGPALAWALLNFSFFIISVPVFHRYHLKGELRKWYVHDTIPAVAATAAVSMASEVMTTSISASLPLVAITFVGSIATSALALGLIRQRLTDIFSNIVKKVL